MATEITWLGHGAFQFRTGKHTILIDPFLTGNPKAACKPGYLSPTHILVSHGHADHVGDTVEIAKRTGAEVFSNFEIASWLKQQGVKHARGGNLGGAYKFPFGRVKLTLAHHSSVLPDGTYGGNPAGLLLYLEDGNVYHACDTALFGDMRLIGEEDIHLAILPIGDFFTMGIDDSIRAIKLIQPRRVVPDHFGTFDAIAADAKAWADRVRKETKAEPVVLEPGQTTKL